MELLIAGWIIGRLFVASIGGLGIVMLKEIRQQLEGPGGRRA
jgi:hypothetical protein